MRRDDYLLTLTSGLLTVQESAFNTAISYFGSLYEMQEPARPGFVSLAGMDANDQPVNYVNWLKALRTNKVQSVYFYWHVQPSSQELPAHIEAAFAGAQTLLMQITTTKETTTYRLRTLFSPQHEISPQQFTALINAQQCKEQLWKRIEELINDSNALNDKPAVPEKQVAQYLQSRAGSEVYNYMVSQLVQEVQVECEVLATPFQIPGQLQSLLYRSDFVFGDDDRFTAYLNPVNKATPDAILQLVQAQPFHHEVWAQFETALQEYPLPNVPSTGWPAALPTIDEADLQEVANTICRAIRALGEKYQVQPIIPEPLLQYFGPNELEVKRARARGGLGSKQWYLQSIQQPWELYVFTPVSVPAKIPQPAGAIQQQFINLIQEIAVLAKKLQSPFAEAFQVSEWLLTHPLPAGNFDDAHANEMTALLQANGFSEQAIPIFNNTFAYTRDLHLLQWPAEKIFALCAISMADVFGGMGSWNDTDPGEDAATFERLSATLFEVTKKYFAALLSLAV